MVVHTKHDIYISVYVDDITIHASDTPHAMTLLEDLKTAFEITDLGEATFLLGLHLTYTSDRIHLT